MPSKNIKTSQDPFSLLREAINELKTFTQPENSHFKIDENGHLEAAIQSRLNKMISLASRYIAPLIPATHKNSEIRQIEQVILRAKDIVLSHSRLIEEYAEGDENERLFAKDAIKTIQEYNNTIRNNSSSKFFPSCQREELLCHSEISHPIEIPRTISVKYDSHKTDQAQKILKELSEQLNSNPKSISNTLPTHLQGNQLILDTFKIKGQGALLKYLGSHTPKCDILQLVNQFPIHSETCQNTNQIVVRQFIEMEPGTKILLTGNFQSNTPSCNAKFMTIATLTNFDLEAKCTHTGHPLPSQLNSWGLNAALTDAKPLRISQTPLFQAIDQERIALSKKHLDELAFKEKQIQIIRLKKTIFDQSRHIFVPLHRQLQETLLKMSTQEITTNQKQTLDLFYQEVMSSASPFDLLTKTQQRLLEIFIDNPFSQLEKSWLENSASPLRNRSPQEKLKAIHHTLDDCLVNPIITNCSSRQVEAFIMQQGECLSSLCRSIKLQYLSEKMGFAPPFLRDEERCLQALSFEHLISFINESKSAIAEPEMIEKYLLESFKRNLQFLRLKVKEEKETAFNIVNELEVYLNSRFYEHYN